MTPPPLPKPIDFRLFYGRTSGTIRRITPALLREAVEDAHVQARDWINGNPGVDIVSISNGDPSRGDMINATCVSVWFRRS